MKMLYRLLTISLLVFAGCQSSQNKSDDTSSLKNMDDADFKQGFKDLVMCHCVMQGIGDKKVINQIEQQDKTLYDPIDFVFEDRINQIVAPVIAQIKRDSVTSLTTVGEGAQGKRVFSTCLRFYESQTLDSATRVALNVWKHTNVDSVMTVKAPAY